MKQETASWVVSVDDFYDHAAEVWEKARAIAAEGMVEPLQTMSFLTFCRHVDCYGQPMDSCKREDGKFAVCTVTCKDLGAEESLPLDWEPMCKPQQKVVLR